MRLSQSPAMSRKRHKAAAQVEGAVSTSGRLGMTYNNAGILGPMRPMMEETAEGFDDVNAVNLRGVWTCMKHELLQMKKQANGAIVNCSCLGGLVGLPGRAPITRLSTGDRFDQERRPGLRGARHSGQRLMPRLLRYAHGRGDQSRRDEGVPEGAADRQHGPS